MPVKLTNGTWLQPTTEWRKLNGDNLELKNLDVDKNFYIKTKKIS